MFPVLHLWSYASTVPHRLHLNAVCRHCKIKFLWNPVWQLLGIIRSTDHDSSRMAACPTIDSNFNMAFRIISGSSHRFWTVQVQVAICVDRVTNVGPLKREYIKIHDHACRYLLSENTLAVVRGRMT